MTLSQPVRSIILTRSRSCIMAASIYKSKLTEEEVKTVWRNSDSVCFDVDSTVITEEGIDCLAEFCGKGDEVAEWTKRAMGGSIPYGKALEIRLEIIKPLQSKIDEFIRCKPPKLTEGVKELVAYLSGKYIPVYLISGGFLNIIEPIADELNIPHNRVFANKLFFDSDGNYEDFDRTAPTSNSGGKSTVLKELIKKHNYQNLVFIGDGFTDLETTPVAKAFIGFGGNVIRKEVKDNAGWFVTDFKYLKAIHEGSN